MFRPLIASSTDVFRRLVRGVAATSSPAGTSGEVEGVYRDWPVEAFGFEFALGVPGDVLPSGQFPHDSGGEDLASLRSVADSGGELDRRAEQVAVLGDRFAGVETDSYADVLFMK